MKIVLFSLYVMCLWITDCKAQKGFEIRGKVPGIREGVVALCINKVGTLDTFAKIDIKAGEFYLKGDCPEATQLFLSLPGQGLGHVPFYLENATYDIEVCAENVSRSVIKGGSAAQQLSNQFRKLELDYGKKMDDLRDPLLEAAADGKMEEFHRLIAVKDSIDKVFREQQEDFLKEHSDSYLALDNLVSLLNFMSAADLQAAFSKFSPEIQAGVTGRFLQAYLTKASNLEPGNMAPNFVLPDSGGKNVDFYSIRARAKLIDFWASWCGPCRELTPEILKLYEEFHDKGFEVIGVSFDSKRDAWLKAVEEEKTPWVHVSDLKGHNPNNPMSKKYNVAGIPHLVLVDENNTIVLLKPTIDQLRKALSRMLK